MQYTNLNVTHGLKLLWLLTVLLAFYYNLHAVPLFDIDEGAFAQATREMALRDDYLSLYLNGKPRHDKPILTYWLQAISVAAFGVNEFAFRLPSAIAATLWNLLIVLFTWRLTTPRSALIAGILMAGTLGTGIIGKAATADALLNLCLTGTLFSLYFNMVTRKSRYLVATAIFASLGFLTKGPIALLIPGMVSLIYSIWNGQLRQWVKIITSPTAWLVFLSVGLPWYIINYLKLGSGFIEGFIGVHNIGRFTQAMENHSGPWWYYLPAILLMAFPFAYTLLQPLTRLSTLRASPFHRFLITWFVFVVFFFSLSATKLPHYILYGLTPLYILSAVHLKNQVDLRPVYIPLLVYVLMMLALPYLVSYFLPYMENSALGETLGNPDLYLPGNYYLILLIILICTAWLMADHRWSTQGRLLSAGIITIFTTSELLIPMVGKIQQEPIREAGRIAAKYQTETVMWRINHPSFSVYSGRITPKRKPTEGELVLTKSRQLTKLPNHKVLYERQGIALALIDYKEKRDVSRQSPPIAQDKSLGDTAVDTLRSPDRQSSATQYNTVFMAKQTGADSPESSFLGNIHHTWGWLGSDYPAVTILQVSPKGRHLYNDFRTARSPVDTPAQSWFRYPKAGPGLGQGYCRYHWASTQAGQFPIWPYRNLVRVAGQHDALAKAAVTEKSTTGSDGHWHPCRYLPHRSRRTLARGYPGRRLGRLDFRCHCCSADPKPQHHTTTCQLVGAFAYFVRCIPAFISPYRLYERSTDTPWSCPACTGTGLSATSERTAANSGESATNFQLKP
jgi:4-amino-4-deoxy-L-arabinose transferase-like glycosyltransferase